MVSVCSLASMVPRMVAEVLDVVEEVGREGVAFADEEGVGFGGGAAEAVAGEGDVGGASGGLAVRVLAGDFAEGAGDGAEVAGDELGEDGVEIGEMAADGGRREAHGDGQTAKGEVCAAETEHEGAGGVEDAVFAVELAGGEDGARVGEIVGVGAEGADGDWHGGGVIGKFSAGGQVFVGGRLAVGREFSARGARDRRRNKGRAHRPASRGPFPLARWLPLPGLSRQVRR